jgi:hypothetical protein
VAVELMATVQVAGLALGYGLAFLGECRVLTLGAGLQAVVLVQQPSY